MKLTRQHSPVQRRVAFDPRRPLAPGRPHARHRSRALRRGGSRLARSARDARRERRSRAQHVQRPARRPVRRSPALARRSATRPSTRSPGCTIATTSRRCARAAPTGRWWTRTTLTAPGSWPALLAAAGTAHRRLRRRPRRRRARWRYALVRPPGHHASSRTADGYCFFNNTALAAENARRRGIERVAILDWDVHHGNGTQTLFYERDDVLTVSWHMAHGSWGASHPETGAPTETGTRRRRRASTSTSSCRSAAATMPTGRPSTRSWRRS